MSQLVLSLFPGIGLLDMAFELEGFVVVQDRDWIFGGDVRVKHFPSGKFDGIIGGPPCQMFSRLARIVRHNGHEPKFGNLIPEFERVVREAQPAWFVMENVPDAPVPSVDGYDVKPYMLNNRQCMDEDGNPATANRLRRFSWGWRGINRPPLMIDVCAIESRDFEYAACGGSERRNSLTGWTDSAVPNKRRRSMPFNTKSAAAAQELCRKQGLPESFLEQLPFRKDALCKAIGNGVPLPMGRAIAKAVLEATR